MNNKNNNTEVIALSYKKKVIKWELITNYLYDLINNLRNLIIFKFSNTIPNSILGFRQLIVHILCFDMRAHKIN